MRDMRSARWFLRKVENETRNLSINKAFKLGCSYIQGLNHDFQMPKGLRRVTVMPIHIMLCGAAKLQVELPKDVCESGVKLRVRETKAKRRWTVFEFLGERVSASEMARL